MRVSIHLFLYSSTGDLLPLEYLPKVKRIIKVHLYSHILLCRRCYNLWYNRIVNKVIVSAQRLL